MAQPAPKWRQIAEAVAADIRAGVLAVGDKIPAARDLAHSHRVDTNTAREATRYLQGIGVLRSVPGSGTYVAALPPEVLPDRLRLSPLERRVNERMDALERRIERLERSDGP